jgi:hypothetical protein
VSGVDTVGGTVESSGAESSEGGDMAGTRDDAMLMVELAKWGSMIGLGDASRAIFADDFDPETAEASDQAVQTHLFFNETIGTLVKNGLLDRDLVYDWLWVDGVWGRIGPAALRSREKTVPQMFENFEALAVGQREPQPA